MELPAKLLDYFLRNNKSIINQDNSNRPKESLDTEEKGANTTSLTQGRVEVVQYKCC